jgi:methylthioribose-1-phosphate isomerase
VSLISRRSLPLRENLGVAASSSDTVRALSWTEDALLLLDQRLLPGEERYQRLTAVEDVARAIRDMVVRGAPAIGICAAYGAALAVRARYAKSPRTWRRDVQPDLALLRGARPTAVNLGWALDRMAAVISQCPDDDPSPTLLEEARSIHAEDVEANQRMGALGAELLPARSQVLTHCNTGSLATGGYGTALGVIRSAYTQGKLAGVFVDETRPWLQGARLTAWELARDGIPATLLVDSAAAQLLQRGEVSWVIVGADRITARGDVANKIGTYGLAVLCRYHNIRFMVVAPTSTIDLSLECGGSIPIEQRDAEEVLGCAGRRVAPGVQAINPAFDVTPAELVDALVTERGVILQPSAPEIRRLFPASRRPL